uniref:MotA/TolQ/ExbB proton channel family protein n=1 Tax=Schlesneria paludicola TaxID=360056 RepID=A0A7C4QM07_9PLAN
MQTSLRTGWFALAVLTCVALWSVGDVAPAWGFQDEGAEAAAGDEAAAAGTVNEELEKLKNESYLAWMIRASGIFGFLILLVSFVMVALIAMQLMQLRRDNYIPAGFVEEFERLLNEKNYQAAYEAAKGNESFIGKVLAAGMARLSRGYEDALQGMQEVGDEETMAMEHSIGYLALIGSIAPMLGLLGTVQGMVASFKVIATSATQPKPYELANGIATALFTTLEGLVVAIPAIICFTIFKNRLARFVLECGFVAEELMKRFQGMPKTAGAAQAAGARPAATAAVAASAPTAS